MITWRAAMPAGWAPIYHALGMSVGVLQMASRTENGKNAFLVDLDKRSPLEDQDQLRMVDACPRPTPPISPMAPTPSSVSTTCVIT